MSKIIFFDIDGTLYDSRIGIPESTVNALNRLIANEHKIVMCTGRSKGMIPEEYFHMGFDGVILGAGTYVEYEGKILHQELMTPRRSTDSDRLGKETEDRNHLRRRKIWIL